MELEGLGVSHRESVQVSQGANVESFKNWLDTLPPKARISVSHSTADRNMGTDYTISASWYQPRTERKVI